MTNVYNVFEVILIKKIQLKINGRKKLEISGHFAEVMVAAPWAYAAVSMVLLERLVMWYPGQIIWRVRAKVAGHFDVKWV